MFSLKHTLPLPSQAKTLILFMFLCMAIQTSSLHFTYPKFEQAKGPDFILDANINGGAMQISPESTDAPLQNTSGRVLYKDPFKLHRKRGSIVASFATTFVLNIKPQSQPGGEGLAFILTNNLAVPSNSYGQWLGIVNKETNGSSLNHVIAVEFDTRKSYNEDIDDNHVGVNVNSINSVTQFPLGQLGVHLSLGLDVMVSIRYDGEPKIMTVDVSMVDGPMPNSSNRAISLHLDLPRYLLEDVYVGFSASTGDLSQLSYIKSWNFTSWETGMRDFEWLMFILPVILFAIIFCLGFICYIQRRTRTAGCHAGKVSLDLESMLTDSMRCPHRFSLKQIRSATRNFSLNNKLGRGGFGTVYKGFLDGMDVAIKRVSKDSRQGMQEFLAEVTTISRLRHKNLVKLLGWCHEDDELLLVYEFLPRGSLDKLIFPDRNSTAAADNVTLSWEKRHKIICGVASALSYLHDGCEMRVLHRDVKASNVMIDSDYNAQLGDFGLARTVQFNGETHHYTTAVAGTPGYIAPECSLTGRARVESDVYGFGVFTMEVACGRRPSSNHRDNRCNGDHDSNIVDWLWDLYGRQRVFDAVDPRLLGVFDKEQMGCVLQLGLACCHPNPNERPTMRAALHVLNGEAAPPVPPNEKPTFMWPVMNISSKVYSPCLEDLSGTDGGGYLSPCTDLSGR